MSKKFEDIRIMNFVAITQNVQCIIDFFCLKLLRNCIPKSLLGRTTRVPQGVRMLLTTWHFGKKEGIVLTPSSFKVVVNPKPQTFIMV